MIEVTENDAREYLENLHKIGAADSSELQAAKKKLAQLRDNGAPSHELDAAQAELLRLRLDGLQLRESCYATLLLLSQDDLRDCRMRLAAFSRGDCVRELGKPSTHF
jgi:hypothetical protein